MLPKPAEALLDVARQLLGGRRLVAGGPERTDHQRDDESAADEGCAVYEERSGGGCREEEATDRRADELGCDDLCAVKTSVRTLEITPIHDHRHDRLCCVIEESLAGAQKEDGAIEKWQ